LKQEFTLAFSPFFTHADNSFGPPLETAPRLKIFTSSFELFIEWISTEYRRVSISISQYLKVPSGLDGILGHEF
jgi:hypothetical protein